MQKKKTAPFLSLLLCCTLLLTALAGCAASSPVAQSQATESFEPPESANQASDRDSILPSGAEPPDIETGLIPEQVLEGETGTIHYSYYLPENYDPQKNYPLMMVMPGYDMMWFGEESSGSNLSWDGFLCWTKLPEEMIVVSAQLTDWHETSARQAMELTEYFIDHFSVDQARVYAAGYSAGGETMSQAVSMRPDLYAAYLHGASQWDGDYAPIAENGVAVYIFMAEHDEYYGSERAWDAYNSLRDAYIEAGWSEEQISEVLQIQTPDDEWFAQRGITGNYHGGGNAVFGEKDVLNWVLSHSKESDIF